MWTFSNVLEREFEATLRQSEGRFIDEAMALIVQRRTEAERLLAELELSYDRKRTEIQGIQERTLREIDSEGRCSLTEFRISCLERALQKALIDFRQGPRYSGYLRELSERASKILRIIGFECESLEAKLLGQLFPEIAIVEKSTDRWGGLFVLGKGGAVLDCTFHTCWKKLRNHMVLRGL